MKKKDKSAEMFPQTRWIGGRTIPSISDAKVESVAVLRHKTDLDFLYVELSKTKSNLAFPKRNIFLFSP